MIGRIDSKIDIATTVSSAPATVLGPAFKDELLPDVDPTTIQGDSFFTDRLSQGEFNNTTENSATALQDLINANPEVATDPILQQFIVQGQVDLTAVADDDLGADSALSDWFRIHGAQYGYDHEIWTTQRQDGRDNNNWDH